MSDRNRLLPIVSACVLLFAMLLSAVRRLPDFGRYAGPYGDIVMAQVVEARHTEQGVAAVTFDYRGFDTLGEEFLLFASVAGVLLLSRPRKEEREGTPRDRAEDRVAERPNEALLLLGTLLFPVTLVAGFYVILHGHLTPGGGFQGGVLTATGFLFLYLSGEYGDFTRLSPEKAIETIEAAGAACFAGIALAGLAAGGSLLENFLPLGETGKMLSAGTLPLLNIATGLEVFGAFLLILAAFLRQAIMLRRTAK